MPPFTCTYRIQLHKDFTFQHVAEIADYLSDLGVSHIYLSPVFESSPGSMHGYDCTDFTRISAERGGEEGFRQLDQKLKDIGLGLIIDIVPNHMSTHHTNPYWWDVLQKGRQSRYWHFFDLRVTENEKIRLPVLPAMPEGLPPFKIKNYEGKPSFFMDGNYFPLHSTGADTDDLKALYEQQHYMLTPHDFSEGLSYRRFFHINELVAIRMEDEKVFDIFHEKIFAMMDQYKSICGLRVDHIDGLAAPGNYLKKLAAKTPFIWIEKILQQDEELQKKWKTKGTTGYEFISAAGHHLLHKSGLAVIEDFWKRHINNDYAHFDDCVSKSKQETILEFFPSETRRIASLLEGTSPPSPEALSYVTAATTNLPVYRTYAEDGEDAEVHEDFVEKLVKSKAVTEWQQLTGAVMAKGLEDRAHYRYTPLAAFNEVGCSPVPPHKDFFEWLKDRHKSWPLGMNATSTHDTKRSEDARSRLTALADIPGKWIEFYRRISATYICPATIKPATNYFIYQSLVASWPLDGKPDDHYKTRIQEYMLKAAREASLETSWINQNEDFEKELHQYIDSILNNGGFIADMNGFMPLIARAGAVNSLSMLALKTLNSGIPDIYQGNEIWDFSLTDPDNRRPVPFEKIRNIHADIRYEASPVTLLAEWQTGAIKMWLTKKLLDIRRQYLKEPIAEWIMEPLEMPAGRHNLCGYILSGQVQSGIIILLPLYPAMLLDENVATLALSNFKNTQIPLPAYLEQARFHDLITQQPLTRERFAKDGLFKSFPLEIIGYEL